MFLSRHVLSELLEGGVDEDVEEEAGQADGREHGGHQALGLVEEDDGGTTVPGPGLRPAHDVHLLPAHLGPAVLGLVVPEPGADVDNGPVTECVQHVPRVQDTLALSAADVGAR